MCQDCKWDELSDKIESMVGGDGEFDYASDTLYGILEWVTDHHHATEKQWDTVERIEGRN